MWQFLVCLCILLIVNNSNGFGFSNPQIPLINRDTRRLRWFKSTAITMTKAGGATVTTAAQARGPKCANRGACTALDKVNPIWRYRPTFIETFTPYANQVLIAYDQDDEGAGVGAGISNSQQSKYGSLETTQASQSTLYTGIVVAVGSGVTSTTLKEGVRVYISTACTARWTTATYAATYGFQNAAAMNGKFMNGVDLSNANGLSYSNHPFADIRANEPDIDFYSPASTTFGGSNYPGLAGDSWTTQGEETGPENPNQQSNYLVCPETNILGIVTESNFPNLEDDFIVKATYVHRATVMSGQPRNLKTQFQTANPGTGF